MRRWLRFVLVSALVSLALPAGPAMSQPDSSLFAELSQTDFAREPVDSLALRSLRPWELSMLRGIVFGRHGRVFRNDGIQIWLAAQPWYRPDTAFRNTMLNDIERASLDLIREAEAATHDQIEPGDLRWWQSREMTAEALGTHSTAEWSVLRAEVEAVHGRRFDAEPWLQHYFDERYWYRPDAAYDASRLGAIDRRNLALIDSLSRGRTGAAVAPCDMGPFEERAITEEQLRGSSLTALRILRNEIYARRGRMFSTVWLAAYFFGRSWYVAREGPASPLTATEQRNVATIAAYERKLRASLSREPLDPALLEGMYLEDARRLRLELYARHGRVFARKWMQDYVAGLEGYRPDPHYSAGELGPTERANLAVIAAYEKHAASVTDAVEG
jgi:hypothetical protein